MKTLFIPFVILGLLLFGISTTAQQNNIDTVSNQIDIAKDYIQSHLTDLDLVPADTDGMIISDMYTDKSSGITRIYFQQHHDGIPVYNAILNISITKEGKVFFKANRFVKNLAGKANTTTPTMTALGAVNMLSSHLKLSAEQYRLKRQSTQSTFVFEKGQNAKEDITAMLCFQPLQDKLLLAWDIYFAPANTHDTWSTRVDALTGHVLKEDNHTLYCNIDERNFSREENDCQDEIKYTNTKLAAPIPGPQYNVWPAPIEDPDHGSRTMIIDPSDPLASPFGWHDTNGQPGPEYTITGGNNAYAYQDRNNTGYSSGDEPDGGPDLHFDFPYDPSWEPEQYIDAAVVNLFYWINYMHDFSYHFGFDETAGNFQKNNYGRGGTGNDFIWAVAQDGANGDTLHNNAAYVNKNEGMSPSIFMFDFIQDPKYLMVNQPASIAGRYLTNIPSAGWGEGSYVTDTPVTGEVVVVNDGVETPSTADACQDIINASELVGKIALIDRGACQFGFKALQAQNAGAIGVIICSADNKAFTLAAGPDAVNVHIPIVAIPVKVCAIIRKYADHGLQVTLANSGQDGPARLDSDLSSSLIAHEFGHGISIRLAGGPNKECLDNAEQMGEGWSDFFGLVTTVQPGDTGTKPRGLGTFIARESLTDNGLRQYPYSTDMNISPMTYGDVAFNQEKHDLGEVWASMLWDMYWALADKYGWTSNLYDETSGNYKAVRLVIDGLKNMACDPGFVDGRDAILAADEALYNGENQCLLWEVFARRGLGYSADQGSPYDAGDQTEAFDLPPTCTNKIIIEKSVTDFVQPGDDIQVTIRVGNYKNDSVSNVMVTDEIPEGTSFKLNSSNHDFSRQGNILQFEVGSLASQKEDTISYTLQTSPTDWSKRKFLDEVQDENDPYWIPVTIGTVVSNDWSITDTLPAHSGNFSWSSTEVPDKTLQILMLNPDVYAFHVDGEHPALRFYHRYQTVAGINGGVVEVREVGTTDWKPVSEDMLRQGYRCTLDYRTFLSSEVEAFSGNSGDEYRATYVDLSKWAGKDIQIRFRFGTYTTSGTGAGWLIDDIEFMDLLSFNEEACLTSDQGDYECAFAPEQGTIVDSREEFVSATEPLTGFASSIYPNPAQDVVTIALSGDHLKDVVVSLLTLDGKTLIEKPGTVVGNTYMNINISDIPSGLYIVKVSTASAQSVEKVIIQK